METNSKVLTDEEKAIKDKILSTAQDMFMSIGVRSVTMDDLSSELGISKKTLYQYISQKSDLVDQCVRKELSMVKGKMDDIKQSSQDSIEEMLLNGRMVLESLKRFNTRTIFEMKKFYPESWNLVEEHQSDYVFNSIRNNLLRGIDEGLYRPEINVDILSQFYIGSSGLVLEVNDFGGHSYLPSEVYMEFFNYHIRGIASPRGVGKLAIYKNKIKFSI